MNRKGRIKFYSIMTVTLIANAFILLMIYVQQAEAKARCSEKCQLNRKLAQVCPSKKTMTTRHCQRWLRVAQCESGDPKDRGVTVSSINRIRWKYNGAYKGGLQFTQRTWNGNVNRIPNRKLTRNDRAMRVSGAFRLAHQSSSRIQILTAETLRIRKDGGGLKHWPKCGKRF